MHFTNLRYGLESRKILYDDVERLLPNGPKSKCHHIYFFLDFNPYLGFLKCMHAWKCTF